jgi:hypothetical protein
VGEAQTQSAVGRAFVEAFAAKDFERVHDLVDANIDFRGLTPSRSWEASGPSELISVVLRQWLEDTDHVDELVEVETDEFADRHRIAYSIRGHNADGPFVFEQQAYFTEADGRINWMRVVCSGFRPA